MKQVELLKKQSKSYGGELLKTRKGRAHGRPLDTKNTMHLVLRSSKAKGGWSFKKAKNEKKIRDLVQKFSNKYGVRVLSLANVGNHLHFQIKLSSRHTYKPFIRALTAAVAMAVTGASRWNPLKREPKDRFWDYRPFTRVVQSFKAYLNLRDYIQINQIEGFGYRKHEARFIFKLDKLKSRTSSA
ncbi:MAG: transposase [Pseudobdellovibrionaceae bacterium]